MLLGLIALWLLSNTLKVINLGLYGHKMRSLMRKLGSKYNYALRN